MKKITPLLLASLYSSYTFADMLDVFRFEDGRTNWQYVANTSGSLLIIALAIVTLRLYFSRREARSYNSELETIKAQLEERVEERTATLKRSESYITDILRSMPLMLVGLDQNGSVTQWNRRAEEISGIAAADALGHNLWKLYPSITVLPQQVQQARDSNQAVTLKHCQRGQYHFDITIYPLGDQTETGVVILIDDVTQRILAENMLIQRDKMSSMGELAATMAHDINPPLQAVVNDVSSVRERLNDNEFANEIELLRDASVQAQQVSSVLKNLLEFSSTRGGEIKPCNIPEIIDHSIELAQDVLSSTSGIHFRDIELTRNYDDELPQIPGYTAELQQVFLSLFRHACHAIAAKQGADFKPSISVEVSNAYDALWIKVQHNGIGLTSEQQQLIFEPFFNSAEKADDSDAASRLSFSHFIITDQHRGEMAVTSDVEQGSTFHIQLQAS